MPTSSPAINREDIEAFITDLLDLWKPTTAHNRYRTLGSFFRWLVDEGEIRTSPVDRMKAPRPPETPPPVLREAREQSSPLGTAECSGLPPLRWSTS
jgi:site-specific recombinase XerD